MYTATFTDPQWCRWKNHRPLQQK